MKPLGRKYYNDKTGGKHHIRHFGKFMTWWDKVIEPCKRRARRQAKRDIAKEIDD